MWSKEAGQTLIEIIVVITVGILVVGALTFAVLFSLRNAKFSQNQNQATKLSQEGLEKVRNIRNRNEDGKVIYNYGFGLNTSKFSDLWGITCSACYFKFTSNATVLSGSPTPEDMSGGFKRQIIIEEETPVSSVEKKVTVVVKWTDSTGDHQSKITTFLGKI